MLGQPVSETVKMTDEIQDIVSNGQVIGCRLRLTGEGGFMPSLTCFASNRNFTTGQDSPNPLYEKLREMQEAGRATAGAEIHGLQWQTFWNKTRGQVELHLAGFGKIVPKENQ